MFKQIVDGKGHYPLVSRVTGHLNARGHNYANWQRQERDRICPDAVIKSPAVDSTHYYRGLVTAPLHLATFNVILRMPPPSLRRLLMTKSIR